MKSILFIGHNAGLSGAPIVLLELIKWLHANKPGVEMALLLLNGGELEEEYRNFCKVHVASSGSRLRRIARRLIGGRLGVDRGPRYDVVFGNTVLSLPYLAEAAAKGSPTVCWAHEMEYAVTRFYSRQHFAELSGRIDRFIAVSAAVERALRNLGLAGRVDVLPEIARELPAPAADAAAAVRRELGFSEDAFLVGGGGSIEWRKGTDLFMQLVAMAARAGSDIRFVWVGGKDEGSEELSRVLHDVKRLGIEDRVRITGITREPEKYLSAIDVFALTSREDPFPLICLEAAGFGKPILCFDKGGGMTEFVGDDCGFVVPYLDLEAFRNRVFEMASDESLRRALGAAAAEKVKRTASADAVGGGILRMLEETSLSSRTI